VIRTHATPDDLVVVTGDQRGWTFYMEHYGGYPPPVGQSPSIPSQRTLHSAIFRPAVLDPWLAAHRNASDLFVFEFVYDTEARTSRLIETRRGRLATRVWCPVQHWSFRSQAL
jgi:hypothetical protein